MSEILQDQEQQPRGRFVVDNDMKAEWCLSKIRSAKAKMLREAQEISRQMDFYKMRCAKLQSDMEEEVGHYEAMLRPYLAERIESKFAKETKSQVIYSLPTGKLILKHREPLFEYKEKQKDAIEWLKANDGEAFVKTKEELDWAALKKTVTVNGNGVCNSEGEVIPGITVTPREDEFVVEVS